MNRPGWVFSRSQLHKSAYETSFDDLGRAIDSHILNLRRKIEPAGSERCIIPVHGIGYKFVAGADTLPSPSL
jgi:DNA-binding response OmpR family regulator